MSERTLRERFETLLSFSSMIHPDSHHEILRLLDLALDGGWSGPRGTKDMAYKNRWLTPPQVAELIGFTVRFLEIQRQKGCGPPYYRISNRVRYSRADVEDWLSQFRYTSTSGEGG